MKNLIRHKQNCRRHHTTITASISVGDGRYTLKCFFFFFFFCKSKKVTYIYFIVAYSKVIFLIVSLRVQMSTTTATSTTSDPSRSRSLRESKSKMKNVLIQPTIVRISAPSSAPETLDELKNTSLEFNSSVNLQYSVHAVRGWLRQECELVLPDIKVYKKRLKQVGIALDLVSIPTFQQASVDLISFASESQCEKNKLLESFWKWANVFCEYIRSVPVVVDTTIDSKDSGEASDVTGAEQQQYYWADFVDPCSGKSLCVCM
jgi:hypothetical protein